MTPPVRRQPLALAVLLALPLFSPAVGAQQASESGDAGYQDRIIDPDKLAPLPPDEDDLFDPNGLPRNWRIEAITSQVRRGDERLDETGLGVGGLWETADWGSFSLDALVFRRSDARTEGSGWVGSATLWQRNLPVEGGWRVDNGLGVLNTPATPTQRQQYRFFLPSVPFAGASTSWTQSGRGLQFFGALGQAGVFSGSRVVSFDRADGNVGTAGLEWRWARGWTGAASALVTDGLIVPDDQGIGVFQDGRTEATVFTTTWEGANDRVQGNLHASRGYLGDATGAWLDAQSTRGRTTYNYGAFRLEPGLAWGALPINNDAQGGYLRAQYAHARWLWNVGLDHVGSVSGNSFDGNYANAYARYQAGVNLGLGGSLSVRDSGDFTDFSTRWFADRRSRWGTTRVQLDQARTRGGDREDWQLSLDQDLPMQQGSRLSLSAALGQVSGTGVESSRTWSLAALGGIELGDRLTVDGNARWTDGSGPDAYRGSDINLSLNWRMAPRWWLTATIYHNRGEIRSPFQLDPLAPPEQFLRLPTERSVFLTLRYEKQSGSPAQVLGGPQGSAAGTIRGSVFLDDNEDGVRSASELAAANVTVLLDGRYTVRTDSQGNFEFPRVAVGVHEVTVVPDNLPLPWSFDAGDDRRVVTVRVREDARVDIGATRPR